MISSLVMPITSQLQDEGKLVNEENDWWCEGDSGLARMKTTNIWFQPLLTTVTKTFLPV